MADAGGGDASQGAAEAVVVVVDDGGAEAEAEDDEADEAFGVFSSSLHAATHGSTRAIQTSTTHRRERAIGAVLHRR